MSLSLLSSISLVCFMLGLGCDLTTKDFGPIFTQPRGVLLGATAQLVGHPFMGALMVALLPLPLEFKMGLMVIAVCPGGPSANMFSWLGRADVALCVALTAMSSVVTVFSIPLFLSLAAERISSGPVSIQIDTWGVMNKLFVMSLLPMGIGMLIRQFATSLAARVSKPLKIIALLQLVILVGMLLHANGHALLNLGVSELLAILGVLIGGMLVATLIGKVGGIPTAQRRTITIEVGIQNAVQGIALSTMIPGLDSKLVAFPSTTYALLMYPVVGIYTWWIRRQPID